MNWESIFLKNLEELIKNNPHHYLQPRDKLGRWTSDGSYYDTKEAMLAGEPRSIYKDVGQGVVPGEYGRRSEDITVDIYPSEYDNMGENQFKKLLADEGWKGSRASIALEAFSLRDKVDVFAIMKDKGEMVGIASYSFKDSATSAEYADSGMEWGNIDYLATKRQGYGAKMIQDICKKFAAKKESRGFVLNASQEAVPFYRKIGMIKVSQFDDFAFTPEQVKEFAERGYQSERQRK